MHQREQVAAHPAHVLGGHRQHRAGGNRGVDGTAAGAQRSDTGSRGEVIHRADHPASREDGAVTRESHGRHGNSGWRIERRARVSAAVAPVALGKRRLAGPVDPGSRADPLVGA